MDKNENLKYNKYWQQKFRPFSNLINAIENGLIAQW